MFPPPPRCLKTGNKARHSSFLRRGWLAFVKQPAREEKDKEDGRSNWRFGTAEWERGHV